MTTPSIAADVPSAGATRPAPPAPGPHPRGVERRLFEEPYRFDFFQAVRLLHRLRPDRAAVGLGGPPGAEAVGFRAQVSLSFPPSAIHDLRRPATAQEAPVLVQAFLGLFGPSGVLPRHYTELLHRIERDVKGPERHALRDWLDLFNHRLASLFYRAWEKYRFYILAERGGAGRAEADPFTAALASLIGLGLPPLRGRLCVRARGTGAGREARERTLAGIEDLALLYYGGLLAHRPRCAVGLEAILRDYFRLPVAVQQFRGQWLRLDPAQQTRLGDGGNNRLGVTALAGERVWDLQGKIRVRLGPLGYDRFVEFLPDRAPTPARKAVFLLAHLVRLYVGPTLDFDVQLVLRAAEVPPCRLGEAAGVGPRLGWNTWLGRAGARDADDAVFEGDDARWVDAGPAGP